MSNAADPFRLAVLGGGAWGTALAAQGARAGLDVGLWVRRPELAAEIASSRANPTYLPDIQLPASIRIGADAAVFEDAEALILATPASAALERARTAAAVARQAVPLIIASKGLDPASGELLGTRLAAICPGHPVMVLSGPSFAQEVARNLPTALTLAAAPHDAEAAQRIQTQLATPRFRIYLSDDPAGVQIGGAVKNVVAIACGICDGLRLGANARAALISRGLAEIVRLALACGGRSETLMGLAGLGDLVLTATDGQSRNYRFGRALGEGRAAAEARRGPQVVEGAAGAASVAALAARHKVDMPIVDAVDAVLNRGAALDATVDALLERPLKAEPPSAGGGWPG